MLSFRDLVILDALKEAKAMLEIYYVPNSDGSTPTIDKLTTIIDFLEVDKDIG